MAKTLNRPRKSPKQERSSELVSSIFEACVRILKSSKNVPFSTRSVAELAGISVGSLYQYFPNKESLIGALIEREARRHIEQIEKRYNEIKHENVERVAFELVKEILTTVEKDRFFLRGILPSVFQVDRLDSIMESREEAVRFMARVLLDFGGATDEKTAQKKAYIIVASIGGIVETIIFRKDETIAVDIIAQDMAFMLFNYARAR